jgi:SAM-dependent methyltransferase
MREVVYRQYAEAFENHWWADHRRRVVTRWLSEVGVDASGEHPVLEIGCGAGTDFAFWSRFGPVTGVELSPVALGYLRTRGYARLIEGDLNEVELPAERFELAADFHVLYHEWIKDPAAVLRRMHAALKPGGRLVMSEPAFESLRRGHDEAVMAARRWTRAELVALVRSAGFEVERCSGFLTLLLPAVLLSLLIDKFRSGAHEVDEIRAPSPLADKVLRAIMSLERGLMRLFPLPAGTSWLLLARRPG